MPIGRAEFEAGLTEDSQRARIYRFLEASPSQYFNGEELYDRFDESPLVVKQTSTDLEKEIAKKLRPIAIQILELSLDSWERADPRIESKLLTPE